MLGQIKVTSNIYFIRLRLNYADKKYTISDKRSLINCDKYHKSLDPNNIFVKTHKKLTLFLKPNQYHMIK